jgi:hypothetical protein
MQHVNIDVPAMNWVCMTEAYVCSVTFWSVTYLLR